MFSFVPFVDNLVAEFLVEGEPVSVGVDDAFKWLWVVEGFDDLLVVANEIVVKLDPSGLLLVDHDVADVQKLASDFRVLGIESWRALDAARALVGLNDEQELLDELSALSPEVFLVQMNQKFVVIFHFERDNVRFLMLVEVLSKHIRALGVSLSPFFVFRIV